MQKWLKCSVDRGMFSDEVAVTYPAEGTALTSVFVPLTEVRGTLGGPGLVRVRVARGVNATLAILPTCYQDSVPVSEADLLEMS